VSAVIAVLLCVVILLQSFLISRILRLRALLDLLCLRSKSIDISVRAVEELLDLEKTLRERTKRAENPSTELAEFLRDLIDHGTGIVSIRPDSIFIRGIRD
jgi:hypothetical protein